MYIFTDLSTGPHQYVTVNHRTSTDVSSCVDIGGRHHHRPLRYLRPPPYGRASRNQTHPLCRFKISRRQIVLIYKTVIDSAIACKFSCFKSGQDFGFDLLIRHPMITSVNGCPEGSFFKCIDRFLPRHRYYKRSEEHTSELQSRGHLVCRLLLEKKKRYPLSRSGGD